jgi:phosphate starvation-inducible PhoH-like protein
MWIPEPLTPRDMADQPTISRSLTLDSRDESFLLFGNRDQNLKVLRDGLGVRLIARGDTVQIDGSEEQVATAERAFGQLRALLRHHGKVTPEDVKTVIEVVRAGSELSPKQNVAVLDGGKYLRPRTDGQGRYVQALRENEVVICAGPAGTGKTFLAVGMAVTLLRQGAVKKIVLVRPAVEAGERLGFLPGDLVAKINPYLRPLFDSLNDLMEPDQVRRYMENDIIEIVPLAYMRGRAQPLTSQVLTPFGYRPMGSLQVGDYVVGSDGRPTRVLGVYPQGAKPVYRVVMSDGSSTRCCGEHLWSVRLRDDRRRGKEARVLQTQEMIGRLRCHHYHRFEVPLLSRPVEFTAREVPLDPYALGLLLGDGCLTGSTTPSFATADAELAGALAARLERITVNQKSKVDYVLNRAGGGRGSTENPLSRSLRELNLWGTRSSTKFVPECYLYNTPAVRLAVLQGLLDTDGGPVTQAARTCRVQYTTTSPRLRDDVMFLVRSLGGVARFRTRAAAGRKPGRANGRDVGYRNDAHVLDIRLPAGVAPFRLARKACRYDELGGGRPMRYIDAIEPEGVEPTQCIRVEAPDSLYVTDDFILTHNTLNNAVIILDEGQNATTAQMKMFLTRMGNNSRVIVTGDMTQNDLPPNVKSGLVDAVQRLKDIPRLAIVHLDESDIVRHPLVQQIVRAYEAEAQPRRR